MFCDTLKRKKGKRQIKGHIKWHLWCLRECGPAGSVVSFAAGEEVAERSAHFHTSAPSMRADTLVRLCEGVWGEQQQKKQVLQEVK